MVNPIGPQTGVELPQGASESSRGVSTPGRAREAAGAGESESAASVLKAEEALAGAERNTQKLANAAQEFESLLLAQILKTARETGSGGWLGGGQSHGMSSTMELAEAQLARAMAESGALGIGKLLAGQVKPPSSEAGAKARDAKEAETIAKRGDPEISVEPLGERVAAETSGTPDRPVAPRLRASR